MPNQKSWENWLKRDIQTLLRKRAPALEAWRRHHPTKSGYAKNFENWLLVELVSNFWSQGIRNLKSNGKIIKPSYTSKPVLKGTKRESSTISPDLSLYVPWFDLYLNLEIKTQFSPQGYLDDVRIVQHHNREEAKENYRAIFLWVAISAPDDEIRFEKFVRKAQRLIERETQAPAPPEFITPWLAFVLTKGANDSRQSG